MRPMKMNILRGSHLPILMKSITMTSGSILELGCGMFSTTYLHWECYRSKRRLVTYESKPDYFKFLSECANDYHEVHCIDDWDSIDISEPWSIAFVDHAPPSHRYHEMRKLTHVDYVVAHDTENTQAKRYGYHKIMKLFKYRFKFNEVLPHTTVFSNKFDVRGFKL
jgi:predicted O-methyltransferase YrrM